jgi:nitrogen regulatory protein P-II 1
MREIKAFIHRNRIVDVIHALVSANFNKGIYNLSISDVSGSLDTLDDKEKDYSIEFGEGMITEAKLELICEDERVDEAVALIKENGRTGQAISGWVYVLDIGSISAIEN